MICKEEIKALKELITNTEENEVLIAKSFLEDIVDYFENTIFCEEL